VTEVPARLSADQFEPVLYCGAVARFGAAEGCDVQVSVYRGGHSQDHVKIFRPNARLVKILFGNDPSKVQASREPSATLTITLMFHSTIPVNTNLPSGPDEFFRIEWQQRRQPAQRTSKGSVAPRFQLPKSDMIGFCSNPPASKATIVVITSARCRMKNVTPMAGQAGCREHNSGILD